MLQTWIVILADGEEVGCVRALSADERAALRRSYPGKKVTFVIRREAA